MNHFLLLWTISNISERHRTYFHTQVFLQTDITAIQTQLGLGILAKKRHHQSLLYSTFSRKIEYLRRYFSRMTLSHKCGMKHISIQAKEHYQCSLFSWSIFPVLRGSLKHHLLALLAFAITFKGINALRG